MLICVAMSCQSLTHGVQIERHPPPADDGKADCFDTVTLTNPLQYYKHYSYSACYLECRTRYVLDRCGCRDPLQPG